MQGAVGLLEHACAQQAVRVVVLQAPTNRKATRKQNSRTSACSCNVTSRGYGSCEQRCCSSWRAKHWLPRPVPCDAASAARLDEWPGDAEHKTNTPYSVLKGFELDLSLAPTQRARALPAAVAAAGQVAQKADQGGARALRAMYVRATIQCHECNKLHAVYCKQPLRKLEKLHAGR
jgi:hypothetical protein